MPQKQQQQPIKAKVKGRGGRKHTLAPLSIDPLTGQVLIRFDCIKPDCGCSGVYTVGELIGAVEEFKTALGEISREAA